MSKYVDMHQLDIYTHTYTCTHARTHVHTRIRTHADTGTHTLMCDLFTISSAKQLHQLDFTAPYKYELLLLHTYTYIISVNIQLDGIQSIWATITEDDVIKPPDSRRDSFNPTSDSPIKRQRVTNNPAHRNCLALAGALRPTHTLLQSDA